jgi:hypothetical protein
MFQRNISVVEVKSVVSAGKIIENYPEDVPYPSKLVLGFSNGRPLHVVYSENFGSNEIIIITVYEPDVNLWEDNYSRRKAK